MANGNADFVHGVFVVWESGRIRELAALIAPEITWDISEHPLPDFPNTGSGRDAFLHHLGEYASGWIDYQTVEKEVIEVGDDVIHVLRERAALRGSDVVIDRDIALVWTVDGEHLTRFRAYKTREEALAAVSPDGQADA